MPEPPAEPEPPMNEVPAPEPPAEEMPEEPVPGPAADEPAPAAKPSEDVEDLFKDNDTDKKDTDKKAEPGDAAPGAKPSEDVDDLFKDNDTDKKDADKKADASDAAPAASNDQAADGEVEDLFSEPAKQAGKSASTEPDEELKDDADKLFEEPAQTEAPKEDAANVKTAPQAETAMRLWTDNTGKWHVRARLVVVGEKTVRLLKDTGKYTTVPFERLSRTDLAFVRGHAEGAIAGK
jgi:hypothetical protein